MYNNVKSKIETNVKNAFFFKLTLKNVHYWSNMGLVCKLGIFINYLCMIIEIPATKDDADIFIKTWSSIGQIIAKMLKQNIKIMICTLDRFSRTFL